MKTWTKAFFCAGAWSVMSGPAAAALLHYDFSFGPLQGSGPINDPRLSPTVESSISLPKFNPALGELEYAKFDVATTGRASGVAANSRSFGVFQLMRRSSQGFFLEAVTAPRDGILSGNHIFVRGVGVPNTEMPWSNPNDPVNRPPFPLGGFVAATRGETLNLTAVHAYRTNQMPGSSDFNASFNMKTALRLTYSYEATGEPPPPPPPPPVANPPKPINPPPVSDSVPPLGESENFRLSTYQKILILLQSIEARALSVAVATWQATGDIASIINPLGQRIATSFGGAMARIGGVLAAVGIGALDTGVAIGGKALKDAENDPTVTHGHWNQDENRAARDALRQIESTDRPGAPIPIIEPRSVEGLTSKFDAPVREGEMFVFDPFVASGFEYFADAGSPLFKSFVLPYLGAEQPLYTVEVFEDGVWREAGSVRPLWEYVFETAVDRFRVSGIDESLGLTPDDSAWITGLSFDSSGQFRGGILALGREISDVPEPATVALLFVGALGLVVFRRTQGHVTASTAAH